MEKLETHTARSHKSKWYFPLTIYANQTFPNFVTSAAYIISTISCDSLYKAVIDSAPVLINEDFIVPGIAAEKAGVPRISGKEEQSLKTYHLNEILDIRKHKIVDWFYKLFPDESDLRDTFDIRHSLNRKKFRVIHMFVKANECFTIDDLKREFEHN